MDAGDCGGAEIGAGAMSDLVTAIPGKIWVIELERKRRKGKPVEAVAICTGRAQPTLMGLKYEACQ